VFGVLFVDWLVCVILDEVLVDGGCCIFIDGEYCEGVEFVCLVVFVFVVFVCDFEGVGCLVVCVFRSVVGYGFGLCVVGVGFD